MKEYTKPIAEIEVFENTDIITLSGTGTQDPSLFDEATASQLGLS